MIRILFIIFVLSLFLSACGKKELPEYKSEFLLNNNIYKI